MLVHDIRKNETRVIDFRETAPAAIHEEMLQTNLDLNVRHFFWRIRFTTMRCCLLMRTEDLIVIVQHCG